MMTIGGRNPNAYHNWYHIIGSTYGTWLRGDPRGFRTYRHQQHIEGDYRNPPPEYLHQLFFEYSKRTLRYPPVLLDNRQCGIICESMIQRFQLDGVEVEALVILSNHFHLLSRFPELTAQQIERLRHSILQDGRDPAPRHFTGLARKHASFVLSEYNLKPPSRVWAGKPKCLPIRDHQHQINVRNYIAHHIEQDAAVYLNGRGFLFDELLGSDDTPP